MLPLLLRLLSLLLLLPAAVAAAAASAGVTIGPAKSQLAQLCEVLVLLREQQEAEAQELLYADSLRLLSGGDEQVGFGATIICHKQYCGLCWADFGTVHTDHSKALVCWCVVCLLSGWGKLVCFVATDVDSDGHNLYRLQQGIDVVCWSAVHMLSCGEEQLGTFWLHSGDQWAKGTSA
jgi:hypothetical protein